MNTTTTYRGRHKILNKKTGRMVYKTGTLGKRICTLRKASCKSKRKYTRKTNSKRKYTRKTKSKRKYTRKTNSKRKYTRKTKRKYTKRRSSSSTGKPYRSQSGRVYTSCWSGYKRAGWKMKNGRRVPNCVKA